MEYESKYDQDRGGPPALQLSPPRNNDQFGRALWGIACAAACYPCFLIFLSFLSEIMIGGLPVTLQDQLQLLFIAFLVVAFSLGIAFLIVTPVAMAAIGATWLVLHSVVKQAPWPVVAGIAGGLTGFLFTCLSLRSPEDSFLGQWIVGVTLGPGLATVMGQIGATWTTVPNEYSEYGERLPMSHEQPWLRFDIRQILIATAWVAGILSLLKVTHILGPWSASIVATWFVYQAITLWVVLRLVKKVRGYA